MNHYILENGVEVVLKSTGFSETVTMQVWVGVGSLHETEHELGMSHFLEHMLFKGTKKYGPGEIAATVEMCGGEINAYTTFDNTVYYLTLDSNHVTSGIDLLYEAVAHSNLDPIEFGREKEVILEEIRRSNDSPGSRIGRRVFEVAYGDTPAARPIIGSMESVSGFTRDQVYGYYKKWYVPNNMRIIVVGKFDEPALLKFLSSTFGSLDQDALPFEFDPMKIYDERGQSDKHGRVSVVKGDFKQARVELVFPAPFLEHPDTMALDIAAFALGTGEMGRLSRRLRDEYGLVSSVGASVFSPVFGGIFEVSALLEKDQIGPALNAIRNELEEFLTTNPITDEELERARATLRLDRIYRDETVDGQARSIGFGLKTSLRMHFDAAFTAMMEHISRSEIYGAARRWIDFSKAKIVVMVHDDETVDTVALEQAFWTEEATKTPNPPVFVGRLLAESSEKDSEVVRHELAPGLTLLTKQNSNVPLFTLCGATRGGVREETPATAGLYNFLSGMLGTATEGQSFEEFVGTVEAHGATLEGFSGKDSFGVHTQCAVDDFQIFLPMLIDTLAAPQFPEEQFESLRREVLQSLMRQKDSPSSVCFRKLQQLMYGKHPYSWPVAGSEEFVAKITPDQLLSAYRQAIDGKPWVFSLVSPFDHDTARSILEPFLKKIPTGAGKVTAVAPIAAITGIEVVHIPMDREQSHVAVAFPGRSWGHPDRPVLDVLVNILGGHGGRLFRELRDKESFAYTVSPLISYGCDDGMVGAYIACAPAKAELALARLREEINKMTEAAPEETELRRSINYIVGSHVMGLQKSDSQASTMTLMELYGFGYDDFQSYPERIRKVTGAQVLEVARKLFGDSPSRAVIVGPAGLKSN